MTLRANVNIGVRGEFQIETRDTVTGSRVGNKCFDCTNLVTEEGRDWVARISQIGPDGGYLYYYKYPYDRGSSNGSSTLYPGFSTNTDPVIDSDFDLNGTVVKKAGDSVAVPWVQDDVAGRMTITVQRKAVFSPGELTGTWGKVGIYQNRSDSDNIIPDQTLIAGQQITDGNGDPTTVTFIETEEVTLIYTIYLTVPNVKTDGTRLGDPIRGTASVDVRGTQFPVEIRFPGSWNRYAQREQDYTAGDSFDGTGSRYTPFAGRGFSGASIRSEWAVYTSSAGAGSPSRIEHSNDTYVSHSGTREVISKGSVYRIKYNGTLKYTAVQERYIHGIVFSIRDDSYGYINNYQGTYMPYISLNFPTPFYKDAGDEINIEVHVDFTITS